MACDFLKANVVSSCLHGNGLVVLLLTLGFALLASGENFIKFLEPTYGYGNRIHIVPEELVPRGYAGEVLIDRSLFTPMNEPIYNRSILLSEEPISSYPLVSNVWDYQTRGAAMQTASQPLANMVPISLPQSIPSLQVTELQVFNAETTTGGLTQNNQEALWGYNDLDRNSLGPSFWYRRFPDCSKPYQSPIDIQASAVRFSTLSAIRMYSLDGRRAVPFALLNLGATVSLRPKIRNIIFEGGELPGKFVLYNIHFHWGGRDFSGSEHRLQGRAFPLEMHVVIYNTKYKDMMEAAGKEGGIHVSSVVFERSRRPNVGLNFFVNKLRRVKNPGSQVDIGMFDIASLLPPATVPYYRYRGSLTTPPCTGNVLWSVYSTPHVVSGQQLAQFRLLKLNTAVNRYFGDNSRPTQPLNNRLILTNNPLFSRVSLI